MNRTLVKAVNPTFVINVDIASLSNKYAMGYYNDIGLEQIHKSSVQLKTVTSFATADANASKFVVIDNRGVKNTLVSINIKPLTKCQWCRDDIGPTPIGIPVKHVHNLSEVKFETEGQYCSFECAYADFIRSFSRDPGYRNSECYLHYAFNIAYPNQRLKPAPDFRLHECNGGSLTADEFHRNAHRYYDTGRLKCSSAVRNFSVR